MIRKPKYSIFIDRPRGWDRIDMWIWIEENGRTSLAKPVELEFYEPVEGEMADSTLKFPGWAGKEFLQALAMALVGYGIKVQSQDVSGELKATQEHLAEVQKLLWWALENRK